MEKTCSATVVDRAWAFWDEELGNYLRIGEDKNPGRFPVILFETKRAAQAWHSEHTWLRGLKLTRVFVEISF